MQQDDRNHHHQRAEESEDDQVASRFLTIARFFENAIADNAAQNVAQHAA